jgi:hypothetical protein
MRIQPTDKSIGPGPASPAQPGPAASQSRPQRTDRVELSALSQGAGGLAPERLQELQSSLESDTYSVKSGDVSRRIVDFYLTQAE